MYEFLNVSVILFFLILASYTDLKCGMVPNKLNLMFFIIGFLLKLFLLADLLNTLFLLVFTFIFSYVLWISGLWGGGDLKLFLAIALAVPFDYLPFFSFSFNIPSTLTIFLNSIFIAFFTLTVYSLFYKTKHDYSIAKLKKSLIAIFNDDLLNTVFIFFLISYLTLIYDFGLFLMLFILILYLLSKKLAKNLKIALIFIAFLYFSFFSFNKMINIILSFLIIIFSIEVFKSLFTVFKELTNKEINIANLEEGMSLSKSLVYDSENYFFSNSIFNKAIISSSRYLEYEDIAILKELLKLNKIKNTVKIKLKIPFVPFILLGFIYYIFFGDILFLIYCTANFFI